MKKEINVHLTCSNYLSFQHAEKKRSQVYKETRHGTWGTEACAKR